MSTTTPNALNAARRVRWDVQLMAEDMALRGWTNVLFARRADVSDMTVIRFLRGERQTAKTAKKLAEALGYTSRRYLISSRSRKAA